MNPLLLEPDLDQSAVLNAIFAHFEEAADWPIWQGVDRHVGPPGTAVRALTSMPLLRDTQILLGWRYGWVRWDNWGVQGSTPYKDTKVQMTVAGIWALKFPVLPELYVQLLRLAQERREQLPISFTDAQQATVTSDEMRHALFSKDQWGAFADRRLVQLKLLVEGEGPSPLQVVGHQDGSWAVLVNDNITDWAAVETVVDYVDRMMKLIDPSAALPALNPTAVEPPAIEPTATLRHPAWGQFLELAGRDDHRALFMGAWTAVAGIMATVSVSTLIATGASLVGLLVGIPSAVGALAALYLMFAAVLHLPPHRPQVVVVPQPAEVVLAAYSPPINVAPQRRLPRFRLPK